MPLTAEHQLLVTCARAHLPAAILQQLQQELLPRVRDWESVAQAAYHHGIAPLVYAQLARLGDLPPRAQAAQERLRQAYYSNSVRNTLLYRELQGVVRALTEAGCPSIPLKGAALAELAYHSRALRPMSDIDLLIHREDLERVEALVQGLGYALAGTDEQRAWFVAQHYHVQFAKPLIAGTRLTLEIHWHLELPERPLQIDVAGLWARAVPVTIADTPMLTLSPEDTLLHLCLHTWHHPFKVRLRPLCDVAETLRQYGPQLRWGEILERAAQWRAEKYVALTLSLAQELLQAEVPASALHTLAPASCDARLRAEAREAILTGARPLAVMLWILQIGQGRRWSTRLADTVRPLAADVVAARYGLAPTARMRYVYYPLRLLTLMRRYGPQLRHLQRVYVAARLARWLGWAA